jgi:hypothetical protein
LCCACLEGLLAPCDLDVVPKQDRFTLNRAIAADPGGKLERLAFIHSARQIERLYRKVRGFIAGDSAKVDGNSASRNFVGFGQNRGTVCFTIGENDQSAWTFARNQAGRQGDRATQIAAVGIDFLHERRCAAQFFRKTFDARIAPERHDADAISFGSAFLEQLDDLELSLPAALRHRAGEVCDDHHVDTLVADAGEGNGRDENNEKEQQNSDNAVETGRTASPVEKETQRDQEQEQFGEEEVEGVHEGGSSAKHRLLRRGNFENGRSDNSKPKLQEVKLDGLDPADCPVQFEIL